MLTRRRTEYLFWTIGLLCACYCLFVLAEARAYRAIPPPTKPDASVPTASGEALGRIEIPAIKLSVPVFEDDASTSLLRGVGHIPGTATLGGLGTVGLAGHRDTFLRPLRNIAARMEIRAVTPSGTYHYVVDSTEIVKPEAIRVLDIQSQPKLVLITCYPFYYVGSAPDRFIVHAHLVSVSPDTDRP